MVFKEKRSETPRAALDSSGPRNITDISGLIHLVQCFLLLKPSQCNNFETQHHAV